MAFVISESRQDQLSAWILLVALVWLCWNLASLFWLALAPPKPPLERQVVLSGNTASSAPVLTGFSLFHQAPTAQAAAAPVSSMPMRLEGVFVATPMSRSAAVIHVGDQSRHYQVGQAIESTGLTLHSVQWNSVLLSQPDGSLARLKFGDTSLSAVSNAPLGSPVSTGASLPPVMGNPANGSAQVDAMLSDASRQLSTNPAGYLGQMGVSATGNGYEISDNAPPQIRSQLGLKPGDRIISLNGRPLGQPQQDAQLLEQIRQQRSAQIMIQRGQQTVTINQNF